jgi:hypothetical protein
MILNILVERQGLTRHAIDKAYLAVFAKFDKN